LSRDEAGHFPWHRLLATDEPPPIMASISENAFELISLEARMGDWNLKGDDRQRRE